MPASNLSVTATVGGAGVVIPLTYDATSLASYYASALNGSALNPATTLGGASGVPYLVVPTGYSVTSGSAVGFSEVVVGNETAPVSITGGGTPSQLVFASDTGLSFTAGSATAETILAGGGANTVNLQNNSGTDFVALAAGTGLIALGTGVTTVDTGVGSTTVIGGFNNARIDVEGKSTITAGTGVTSVFTGAPINGEPDLASAVVYNISGAINTIDYEGDGVNASTVFGGLSQNDVFNTGAGGGLFFAGSFGTNLLTAGTGSVTFTGGGSYSYLQGSTTGSDSLVGGTATQAAILAEGPNDTIVGGSGSDTIDVLSGSDTVNVGSGATTVQVASGTSVNGGSGTLYFVGGTAASTVTGGTGSETIFGATGGGYFVAGSGPNNVLIGTQGGAVTLVGSAGSYLEGDFGHNVADLLKAGGGNETLTAGWGADTLAGSSGADVFGFVHYGSSITDSYFSGQTYTITGFHIGSTLASSDQFYLLNASEVSAAVASETVIGGSLNFTLSSGAKVVIDGYASTISSAYFGKAT
jgi:hypothetical protein